MRCLLAIKSISLVCLLVTNIFAQHESVFPYHALTLNEKTEIRSGPGELHYATDEMDVGQVVEVYRHDPGGWCAIRPPQRSFSLLPESSLTNVSNGVGEVAVDGIQAWVGTRMGTVEKPLWQVKLKQGERVAILGEASWPNPEGNSVIWYQIEPPAGEFRWVKLSDLQIPDGVLSDQSDDELPEEIKSETEVAQAAFYQLSESDDGFGRVVQATLQTPLEIERSKNSGWRRAQKPVKPNRIDSFSSRKRASGPFQSPAIHHPSPSAGKNKPSPKTDDLVAKASGIVPQEPARDATQPRMVATRLQQTELPELEASPQLPQLSPLSGKMTKRIADLELLLSEEMIRQPDQWRLRTLEDQARAIKRNATNDVEQEQATRFLSKIQRCKNLQINFESTQRAQNPVGIANSGPVGTGVDNKILLSTTYDAYGWLNQLVSNQPNGESSFVLEDDDGRIIYHIAPAPGLNLRRYLKNKVGVIGRKGYHRRLQLNHVTADRVIVLEKLR